MACMFQGPPVLCGVSGVSTWGVVAFARDMRVNNYFQHHHQGWKNTRNSAGCRAAIHANTFNPMPVIRFTPSLSSAILTPRRPAPSASAS